MRTSPLLPPLLPLLPQAPAAAAGPFDWDNHGHHGRPEPGGIFKWASPYPADGTPPRGFSLACQAEATFHARRYTLGELRPPPPGGLLPYAEGIAATPGRAGYYPGAWGGNDAGGLGREVLVMEYRDVPAPVRGWVEEQQGRDWGDPRRWMFAVFERARVEEGGFVYDAAGAPPGETAVPVASDASVIPDEDKIVVFAAGAIYPILPLWVAEWSECEAELLDLSRYEPVAQHNGTIAWPVEVSEPGSEHALGPKDIHFKVRASHVLETEEGRTWRQMWERLHASARRHLRKQERKQREAARRAGTGSFDFEPEERIKDEL